MAIHKPCLLCRLVISSNHLDKVLFNDIYQIFMSFYVMYDCILSICFIKEMMMMMIIAISQSVQHYFQFFLLL